MALQMQKGAEGSLIESFRGFFDDDHSHRHREEICGPLWGKGRRGTNWETRIGVNTLPYIKQSASVELLCGRESSARSLC